MRLTLGCLSLRRKLECCADHPPRLFYWLPFFSVKTVDKFEQKVTELGGQVLHKSEGSYGRSALVSDSQNGVFGVVETGGVGSSINNSGNFKYKTAVAFTLVILSIIFNWQWFWGLAFMTWVYSDIKSGRTFLVESIHRDKNPF